MRVRILQDVADHVRSYGLGEVCDMADAQAVRWIEAGYAAPATQRVVPAPKAATLKDDDERATLPKAEKRDT